MMQIITTIEIRIQTHNYLEKISMKKPQNQYLDNLIDPSFQGVTKRFVLSFETNAHPRSHKECFLLK